jgi:glycopeptide antibiotics resistance protein
MKFILLSLSITYGVHTYFVGGRLTDVRFCPFLNFRRFSPLNLMFTSIFSHSNSLKFTQIHSNFKMLLFIELQQISAQIKLAR